MIRSLEVAPALLVLVLVQVLLVVPAGGVVGLALAAAASTHALVPALAFSALSFLADEYPTTSAWQENDEGTEKTEEAEVQAERERAKCSAVAMVDGTRQWPVLVRDRARRDDEASIAPKRQVNNLGKRPNRRLE